MPKISCSKDICRNIFIAILAGIVIIKFVLIGKSDVIAHPKDMLQYILMAGQKVWFPGNLQTAVSVYPPGYPLFILLSNLLKIPLRMSHEIFYAFSNLLLIYGFRSLKIPRWICVLSFSVLTFHLYVFWYFNSVFSECLVISLYHILVALTIIVLTRRKTSSRLSICLLCGIAMGFILITRLEFFAVCLCYCLAALLLLIEGRKNLIPAIRRISYAVIIPIAVALSLVAVTCGLNRHFLGVPALCLTETKAFRSVYSQLMSISVDFGDQEADNRLINAMITRKQLREAYKVSPTLKGLEPSIESSLHQKIIFLARKPYTLDDTANMEIASGGLTWSIWEAAIQHNDEPYRVFVAIDGELKKAFYENILVKKEKLFNFSPETLKATTRSAAMSFSKVTGYLLFPSYIDLSIKDDPRVTPAIASIFNEVANRRLSNLGNRNLALERYLTKTSRKIRLLNIVGVISFFILAVYYFMRRKHPPSLKKYIFAVTFIFLLILSRLILYTLIDVFFFPARLRYVFPGMPLLAGVSVANIFTVLKLLSRRW